MDNSINYSLRPDVVISVLEDGAVLLDLETKFFYSVNPSAWAILQMFEIGTTIETAVTQSQEWSGNSESDSRVAEFLYYLVEENLIEPNDQIVPQQAISFDGNWIDPTIDKQKEPLQKIMTSAFDPTMPLAE